MIEDDVLTEHELLLASPVQAIRAVSHDPSLARTVELRNGKSLTAVEMQWELHDLARKYAEDRGLECVGGEDLGREILGHWEHVLHGLESEPSTLVGEVDWVTKRHLLEGYMARHGIDWTDSRVAVADLQYHDVRPERSLFQRMSPHRLVGDDEVTRAMTEPPETTRAYFRGQCLKRFADSIVAANWDSIVFDLGDDPLRRVPMMEPLRGTASHVDTLFEECDTPGELLRRLGS
jgi:proteasome accessory factor A